MQDGDFILIMSIKSGFSRLRLSESKRKTRSHYAERSNQKKLMVCATRETAVY